MKKYKTLPEIFGQATLLEVFLASPQQMLSGMDPKERDAFIEVLNNPDLSFDALRKDDAFTKAAFRHPEEGMNEYPLTPGTKRECLVGPTGYIYSMYHKEGSLATHTALTAGLMFESEYPIFRYGVQTKEDEIVIPRMHVICAFFHDLSKKWCACTNASGGISSYGHAECSAYVANAWLKKTKLVDDRMRQKIVVAIYGHDLIKRWSPYDDFRVKIYQELIGGVVGDEGKADGAIVFPGLFTGSENRQISNFTETIASNDAGVKEIIFDENGREKEYVICWEPFAKVDGDTKELTETLSADDFERIVSKGAELINTVFGVKTDDEDEAKTE